MNKNTHTHTSLQTFFRFQSLPCLGTQDLTHHGVTVGGKGLQVRLFSRFFSVPKNDVLVPFGGGCFLMETSTSTSGKWSWQTHNPWKAWHLLKEFPSYKPQMPQWLWMVKYTYMAHGYHNWNDCIRLKNWRTSQELPTFNSPSHRTTLNFSLVKKRWRLAVVIIGIKGVTSMVCIVHICTLYTLLVVYLRKTTSSWFVFFLSISFKNSRTSFWINDKFYKIPHFKQIWRWLPTLKIIGNSKKLLQPKGWL